MQPQACWQGWPVGKEPGSTGSPSFPPAAGSFLWHRVKGSLVTPWRLFPASQFHVLCSCPLDVGILGIKQSVISMFLNMPFGLEFICLKWSSFAPWCWDSFLCSTELPPEHGPCRCRCWIRSQTLTQLAV